MKYSVLIYSADGKLLKNFKAYDHCLGAKSMSFSLSSQFLAVGSFDEQARVLNHITWASIATYKPTRRVDGSVTVCGVPYRRKKVGGSWFVSLAHKQTFVWRE